MLRFLLVSVTGWTAILTGATATALPYILRNASRVSRFRITTEGLKEKGRRVKMWPHYWLGYTLAPLVLAHVFLVSGAAMGRSDPVGIWAATLALGFLFLQISLGLALKNGTTHGGYHHGRIRLQHFWSMVVLGSLVLVHVVRNG